MLFNFKLQSWVLSKGTILHSRKAQATPTRSVPLRKERAFRQRRKLSLTAVKDR
ncbi:hypothetical protein [Chamaesiphon sp. OTE_8_metabat_110]|uniref:hypothetical protein n=1 Tax=Chamaesiphon sp. OTE_8_metabat_110 TaxID=2964696 RepID=UPI00286BADC4|nr:hypothetical protein [Chamaesiphon sp. OTE_8_metabat_110]